VGRLAALRLEGRGHARDLGRVLGALRGPAVQLERQRAARELGRARELLLRERDLGAAAQDVGGHGVAVELARPVLGALEHALGLLEAVLALQEAGVARQALDQARIARFLRGVALEALERAREQGTGLRRVAPAGDARELEARLGDLDAVVAERSA